MATTKYLRAQLQPGRAMLLDDSELASFRSELRRRRKVARQARKWGQRVARRAK